jgi:predicted DNA-binding transcriptional regulator AlpA
MTLVDVYRLAELWGVSPHWIWKRVRTAGLPSLNFGRGSMRFDLEEVEAWMAQYHQPPQKVRASHGNSTVPR